MSLKNKAYRGAAWTSAASATQALAQILRLSILARFLEKGDFGVIAITILILGFTRIFADFGVSVALFSKSEVSQKEYSSLYWVSIIISIVLYVVLFFSSSVVAGFYEQPILEDLVPIMGLDLIINTIGRQFKVFKQKELQFKSIAIIDIFSALSSLIVAVLGAMAGMGVYSLVYSTLCASALSSLLLVFFGLKQHPLLLYINLKEGKEFYKIGSYQTGTQILDYIASQLDIIIIGKIMSISDLGVYNIVKQLVVRLYSILNPIITSVAIPILATLKENLIELRSKYVEMIGLTSFINFGLYALMALLGKEVLYVMYGQDYMQESIILQILCIWGGFTAVASVISIIVIVRGRTELGFRWTIIRILISPLFVLTGSLFGFVGIVIAQSICVVIFICLYWKAVIVKALNNLSFKSYINSIFVLFLSSIVAFGVCIMLKTMLLDQTNFIMNIILLTVMFSLLYSLINRVLLKKWVYFARNRDMLNKTQNNES